MSSLFSVVQLKKRKSSYDNAPYPWDSHVKILEAQYDAMKNGLYTDFTINTKGGKFNVHRLCLARVPYFYDMFTNNMRETIESEANEDINEDVCSVLLEYIYTGRSNKIDQYADKLIICADKYRMDDLVERCSFSLKNTLCVDNAVRYLACVISVGLDKLKKTILSFIEGNIERVMKSNDWSWFVKDAHTMNDILCELAIRRHYWGCAKGTLSVCDLGDRSIRWDIPKVPPSQTLRFHCYYEFDSPEFVVTDLLGMKYVMKMMYRAKPTGNASVTVFIATRKIGFINNHLPPKLHCKWLLPSHDLCSWHAERWRFIPDFPELRWTITMKPTFPIENPFMLPQVFIINSSDHFLVHTSQLPSSISLKDEASSPTTSVSRKLEIPGPFDTKLLVHGKTFEVHRTVLSSQSRRLAAILSSSRSKYVLEDITPEAFQGLRELLYEPRRFPSQEPDQLELLRTAKQYEIDDCLIEKYECFLAENLNPQNAVVFLLCATEVGSETLKSSAMKFITHNVTAVVDSKGWHEMLQHTALIVDMIGMISSVTESPVKVSRKSNDEWIPNWSLLNSPSLRLLKGN